MNRSYVSIGIVIVSLLAVVTLVILRQQNTDTRSKAAEERVVSSVLPTVVPPPKTFMQPPYIRLVSFRQKDSSGKIPVEVYLYAPEKQIAEAKISLVYNPGEMTIEGNSLENTGILPVLNVEDLTSGRLTFSLFISEEAGYEPIDYSKEQHIATVHVTPAEGVSSLRIDIDALASGLFAPRSEDGSISSNMLTSVEGFTVTQ